MKTRTLKHWIERRGLQTLDLRPKLSSLAKPDLMEDRSVVITRLVQAIRAGELIAVAGDYDVDGMTATAIMAETLRALGGRVSTFQASRFAGGYGLSDTVCDKILASGASVLLTCDFGSSDHPRLERIKSAGIDALVIDHHLVPAEPLPVLGFINPHKPTCGFEFKDLCSGGLAFNIAAGLRTALGADLDPKQFLDLAALATIADVMPLIGDNRLIVSAGLEKIREARRPGVRVLLEIAKLDTKFPFTGRDIAFRIAPLLNAPGRLGPPDIIVQLLMARDLGEAKELGLEVQRLAEVRRQVTAEIQAQAEEEIEAAGWQRDAAIVVGREEWNHGIVGITAGRLTEKFGKPTVVVGSEGRGSVRGPAGSRLHQALTECKDTLVKFGGHQAAAGCEVEFSRLEDFRVAFNAAIARQLPYPKVDKSDLDLLADPSDSLRDILYDLNLLEPCGEGNPRPRMVIEGYVAQAKEVKGKHLSFEIERPGGDRLKCFKVATKGFSVRDLKGNVRVYGDLKHTSFGHVGVECFVEEVSAV